jgi:hypothetical protein
VADRRGVLRERDRQRQERRQQHRNVQQSLSRAEQPGRQVRVPVADEQHGLEEDERGDPDGARTAEQRQHELRAHRLDQENERCTRECSRGEEAGNEASRRARDRRCGSERSHYVRTASEQQPGHGSEATSGQAAAIPSTVDTVVEPSGVRVP